MLEAILEEVPWSSDDEDVPLSSSDDEDEYGTTKYPQIPEQIREYRFRKGVGGRPFITKESRAKAKAKRESKKEQEEKEWRRKFEEDKKKAVEEFKLKIPAYECPESDGCKGFRCQHCKKSIDYTDDGTIYEDHWLKHHTYWRRRKRFRCESCEKSYTTRRALRKHVESHSKGLIRIRKAVSSVNKDDK